LTIIKITLFSILAIYFAINLFAYANQRQLMYFPSSERVSPDEVGLHDVNEVTLRTIANVNLSSWYGPARIGQPTILFFHGNGGAVSHRAQRFRELMAEGFGIFALGYPGYGGNNGRPSESSFLEASTLSYEYLRNSGVAADDIVIYGESIGSGVAVQLAASVEARALILEAPMSSTIDVAREHYPYLIARFLLRDTYQSVDYIEQINMPLLVMHGSRDQVIPIGIGRKLFQKAKDPKTFIELKEAGHNNLQSYSVKEIARDFIESL
jgi:pimeloyl-ACP methyl ester carboxylesterase